jgi:superfamily II DNA/RNA helicase
MPHSSRRPRVSSDRRGAPGQRSSRRRSASQHGGAQYGAPRTPPTPRVKPRSELEVALDAAAAAPPPPAATFASLGLDSRLVRALAASDIHEPFAIQARALPDALAGRDVLGRAQTGSGKTLAFGLPLLTQLAEMTDRPREKAPRGLILVPTRELAQQVADVLTPLGRSIGVTLATVYGGVSIGRQITGVRTADIVVATPGRLIDLLERRACTLGDVRVSVLDEADHMADLGFMPAVTRILDETPAGGQRMFFSATLDREVGQLVTRYAHEPALHAVASSAESVPADHRLLVLTAQDKVPVATAIAGRPGRTLFFVRTKHGADRLAKQFSRAGVEAAAIHGDRNQNQRQRALDGFTAGHPRVLVATDVAARGIHVDDVDLVVQFDPPNDHKDYLHRAGRTARAGATGMVVALAEHGQVRELQLLHAAAGVTAAQHEVAVGHDVVRQIAESGVPVPPAPAPVAADPAARTAGSRRNGRASRSHEGRGSYEGRGRGNAERPETGSRSSDTRRGENASRAANGGRPASASRSANGGRPEGSGWSKGPGQGGSPRRGRSGGARRAA